MAEPQTRFLDIDTLSSERKSYLDSEIFNYNGESYKYAKCADNAEEFIRSFKRQNSKEYHYFEKINSMMAENAITLVVDFEDILNAHFQEEKSVHGDFLYSLLEQNPNLFIKSFRKASFLILSEIHYEYAFEIKYDYKVAIANATHFKKEITEINHDDVGKLIYTENFVLSISSQKNFTKSMAYSCGSCGKLTYKETIGTTITRLRKCMYCDSEDIAQSNKDAITETMQEIKLQQKYERLISGRVPKNIIAVAYGKDMINRVRAGDICAVTGIINLQRNQSIAENAIADYIIDIEWIEKKSDDFLIEDDPELEKRVKKFIDPQNEDEGYNNLIQSIAPSVMGHEIMKEALLLQLVGSDVAYFEDNSRHRGELQILFCGDSSTAKSKLATYVYQLYARAVYVSSKVTEAGMTASVSIANKTGHAILEAGAYLLASSESGGLVVCDEMEKTKQEARESLAGCTDERQMVEIHKGPIHQSIQINCASLHISNPKHGDVWDTEQTIKENTGFENWYLSRFCTWIVRDDIDKELDTQKASHFLKQFGNTIRQYKIKDGNLNDMRRKQALSYGANKNIKSVPEMRLLAKYARNEFHPAIDYQSPAAKKLIKFYISIRPQSSHAKSLRITMRSLGDLIRFSEASARAHFRNEVTEKDADIAIKLVQSSIASSGFNMFTQQYEKKIKPSELTDIPEGFFTAKDLLNDKAGAELVRMDLQALARKRENRFYKEVAHKMKKVVYVIKQYALAKCKYCKGDGVLYEGQSKNLCYNCEGKGGHKQSFSLNEVEHMLSGRGLSNTDIHELIMMLIKKHIIAPKYEDSNTYHVVKPYKEALLTLASIEANTTFALEADMEKHKEQMIKSPEMQEKINKIKRLMPTHTQDQIKKMLESVDD